MNHLLTDRNLMKMKDIVLLVGAMAGLAAGMFRVYQKPFEVEQRIDRLEKRSEERSAKYVPMVEAHEKQIIIMIENQKQIIQRLERIERKL